MAGEGEKGKPVFTNLEAMELLVYIEKYHPDVTKGFVGSVLKKLPRGEYLGLIQTVERLRD